MTYGFRHQIYRKETELGFMKKQEKNNKNLEKTNVMRILEQHKIKYNAYTYTDKEAMSGEAVAEFLNVDKGRVFKTLVTVGKSKVNYVFMLPSDKELDLKKAAASVNEKSIEMLKSKQLLPLTGYIHGGCSPIGMKKQFTTVIDQTAAEFSEIIFSAGKIGFQVEIGINSLGKIVEFKLADIAV